MVRILLIDDSRTMKALWRMHLTELGFSFLEASDGREGLRLALSERPSLIIADLMMPLMDGAELLTRLRQSAEVFATPVVIVSADGARARQVAESEGGPTFVAVKGIAPDAFRTLVCEALNSAPAP
jgi:DNA-binding response OmpR family regulator